MRILFLIAMSSIALLAATPAPCDEEPLRNEDVVMMLVGGENPARVIDVIRTRVTAFDLSEEMMTELGLAGVPDEVLRAMRERQAELDDPTDEAVVEEQPVALPQSGFRVTIEDADVPESERAPSTFLVALPAKLSGSAADRLELPDDDASRTVARAAIAIACIEPRHAPDHWRGQSPLGRDFFFTPRHKLVHFEVGTTADPKPAAPDAPGGVLEVTLPTVIEGPLEGPEHHLLVGLAVEIGDRWYLLRSVDLGASPAGREPSRIDARVRIRASRSPTLEQELERVEADDAPTP